MMRDATALQKSDISFAIIASYSTSVSWLYEFFVPSTPVIMVAQPDQSGQPTIRNILPNWVMTVPFLRNGQGCQHMKVSLLVWQSPKCLTNFIAHHTKATLMDANFNSGIHRVHTLQ
jgi:hypothetical protein